MADSPTQQQLDRGYAKAVRESRPEPPAPRCPHCRQVIDEIKYWQATYNTQVLHVEAEDYDCNDWAEDDHVYGADCGACGGDITTYLIRRSKRYPEALPHSVGTFEHDAQIPRGLPQRTRAACSDAELQIAINVRRVELGQLLDEQTERARIALKAQARAGAS